MNPYSLPDGTVGTRSYSAVYTNLTIQQTFTAGGNLVSSGRWTFPELFYITGPQGENRYWSSQVYCQQTVLETNNGVVSASRFRSGRSLSPLMRPATSPPPITIPGASSRAGSRMA